MFCQSSLMITCVFVWLIVHFSGFTVRCTSDGIVGSHVALSEIFTSPLFLIFFIMRLHTKICVHPAPIHGLGMITPIAASNSAVKFRNKWCSSVPQNMTLSTRQDLSEQIAQTRNMSITTKWSLRMATAIII